MSTGLILGSAALQLKTEGIGSVEADINRLKGIFLQGITSLNGLALASGAAFATGLGVIGGFVKMFETAEDKTRLLQTALRAEGEEVEANTQRLSENAAALAKVANLTQNQVKDLEIMGLRLGISAGQLANYTALAIGLSGARRVSEEQAMAALARANQGNEMALVRLLGERRGHIRGAQNALMEAQRMASKGLDIKAGDINTFAGQMTALKNSALEAGQSIGQLFAPALAPTIHLVTGGIRDLTAWLRSLTSAQIQSILKWAEIGGAALALVAILPGLVAGITAVGAALLFLATNPIGLLIAALGALVGWFAYTHATGATMGQKIAHVWDDAVAYWTFFKDFAKTIWDNIGLIFKIGFLKISDTLYSGMEALLSFLHNGVRIAIWFAAEFPHIIRDAFSFVLTTITNFAKNAWAILKEFWRWASDPTSDFTPNFTPLLDGFHATISKFPALIGPNFTHPLKDAIDELEGRLGKAFDPAYDRLHANLAKADEKANQNAAAAATGPGLPKLGVPTPEGSQKKGTSSDILHVLTSIQGGALGSDPKLAEAKKTNQHLSRSERLHELQVKLHERQLELQKEFYKAHHHGRNLPGAIAAP